MIPVAMRFHHFLLAACALSACAEGTNPITSDAGDDLVAQDVVVADVGPELGEFDVPRFDVPAGDAAPDAEPDAAPDAAPDVATPDVAPVDVTPMDAAPDVPAPDVPAPDVSAPDVTGDRPPRRVDHCYLVAPRTLDVTPGGTTAAVTVAVFASGLTPGAGRGPDVQVEFGFGPWSVMPLDVGGGWTWSAGTWERDIDGRGATGSRDYDQYTGTLTAPDTPNEYAFAARARVGAGAWTACDFVQTQPQLFRMAFAGRLTVAAAGAARVGYCNLQFPRSLALASNMTSTMPVYGRVFARGVTDRSCTDRPAVSVLEAAWGYGPDGSYPSGAWTWFQGVYSSHRDSTNPLVEGNCANVEYQVYPRAPADCATRHYGWRFRLGPTAPWTYCRWAPPADGAPATPAFDVGEPSLAGTLAVTGCP